MEIINYIDVDVKKDSIEYYLDLIKYVMKNENVFITKKEHKESGCIGNEDMSLFKSEIKYKIKYRALLKVEESDLEDDEELIVGDVFEDYEWSEWLFSIETISYTRLPKSYISTYNGNVFITEDEKNLLIKELFNKGE